MSDGDVLDADTAETIAIRAWSQGDRNMISLWGAIHPENRAAHIAFTQAVARELLGRGWRPPEQPAGAADLRSLIRDIALWDQHNPRFGLTSEQVAEVLRRLAVAASRLDPLAGAAEGA